MKTQMLAATIAALMLAGCASDHIVVAHGSVWGVGAEGKPDGTAAAAIGAVIGDVAAVPHVNKKTGMQYTVPTMCGGQDAVSVLATVNGTATNGGVSSLTATVGHDLAVGEPARLVALAALQTAAGPSHDTLTSYHDCGKVWQPPGVTVAVPAATATAPTPSP